MKRYFIAGVEVTKEEAERQKALNEEIFSQPMSERWVDIKFIQIINDD